MIEREILLRAAREFSAQQRQDRTTCVASYLVGSVARDELPLGEAVDLDIVLVDEDPPDKYEECVRITDSVLIECRFSRPDDYDDKRATDTRSYTNSDVESFVNERTPNNIVITFCIFVASV